MSHTIDTAVIGAGVVGLAIARALALAGREVVVIEKNHGIGEETSARNSEVIHAGLYYAAGSLKARLCVTGKAMLYAYCAAKQVPHRRCGKLLVATQPQQRGKLDAIRAAAIANGVTDIEHLSAADIGALEPAVRADSGLWSPSTGIVDSHALMLALRGDLEQAGGAIAVRCRCTGASREAAAWRLTCVTEDGPFELMARTVINAAGLHATRVARLLEPTAATIPEAHFAKGSYFSYAGRSPFTHLVYPMPEEGGLGVHATLDLSGRVRFGPDLEWLERNVEPDALDYRVDPRRADAFYDAIRSYWPGLPDDGLQPAYAGVRPKVVHDGQPATDFAIGLSAAHDSPLAVHLFGIESPGLTAALAIGDYVEGLLARG
jgi:L-2-hydroxyglutarate oxidase LhgO